MELVVGIISTMATNSSISCNCGLLYAPYIVKGLDMDKLLKVIQGDIAHFDAVSKNDEDSQDKVKKKFDDRYLKLIADDKVREDKYQERIIKRKRDMDVLLNLQTIREREVVKEYCDEVAIEKRKELEATIKQTPYKISIPYIDAKTSKKRYNVLGATISKCRDVLGRIPLELLKRMGRKERTEMYGVGYYQLEIQRHTVEFFETERAAKEWIACKKNAANKV